MPICSFSVGEAFSKFSWPFYLPSRFQVHVAVETKAHNLEQLGWTILPNKIVCFYELKTTFQNEH